MSLAIIGLVWRAASILPGTGRVFGRKRTSVILKNLKSLAFQICPVLRHRGLAATLGGIDRMPTEVAVDPSPHTQAGVGMSRISAEFKLVLTAGNFDQIPTPLVFQAPAVFPIVVRAPHVVTVTDARRADFGIYRQAVEQHRTGAGAVFAAGKLKEEQHLTAGSVSGARYLALQLV